jgi:hypothetical protein
MDFDKYGLPGLIASIGIGAIIWCAKFIKDIIHEHKQEREELERIHREERADWKKTIERQFEESNRVTNNNTNVLTAVKTMLENRK